MLDIQIVTFIIACCLIGFSKGGLGGPLPVALIVPMMTLTMDPREAVPLMLPFLIFADWFALSVYWNKWELTYIKLMLPLGIIGIIMGGLLLSTIDQSTLKIFIGIVTIIVLVYKLLSDRLKSLNYTPRAWHAYLAGWTSAFTSTLANTGGPPFTMYMLLQRVEPIPFIATTTLYFTIINLLKVPIYVQQGLLDLEMFLSYVWAFPIIPISVWVGRKSLDYFSPIVFERLMIVLLVLSVIFLFSTL